MNLVGPAASMLEGWTGLGTKTITVGQFNCQIAQDSRANLVLDPTPGCPLPSLILYWVGGYSDEYGTLTDATPLPIMMRPQDIRAQLN